MYNFSNLEKEIHVFEKEIDYVFHDKRNLLLALTHSSYANENKNEDLKSNERLEFLGDSILNLVISENIFINYPELAEGEMTKARANIVCEPSLMKCANNIHIGKYLLLGRGEELTGGRTRISILSDAFEALIGAVYIDGGMEKAKVFIHKYMKQLIEDSLHGVIFLDYKTQLQEIAQRKSDQKISYEIIEEKGPDHDKAFVSQVKILNRVLGVGQGKSKKEAEQNAAKAAIEKDGVWDEL